MSSVGPVVLYTNLIEAFRPCIVTVVLVSHLMINVGANLDVASCQASASVLILYGHIFFFICYLPQVVLDYSPFAETRESS
jgi:hypothetical protein